MRIHVTTEARHLSFARHYLRLHVPKLGRSRKLALAIQAPVILGAMARQMLAPSRDLIRSYGIPRSVIDQAFTRNPAHHAESLRALRKLRALCQELGLLGPAATALWKALGLREEGGEPRVEAAAGAPSHESSSV